MKRRSNLLLLSIAMLALAGSSCTVPRSVRHATYFSDSVTESEKNLGRNPVVIKPEDRLNINITAINKEAAAAFTMTGDAASGYLVDSSGNINLLQLGTMHVVGMNTAALTDTLQKILADYIKGPVVKVS